MLMTEGDVSVDVCMHVSVCPRPLLPISVCPCLSTFSPITGFPPALHFPNVKRNVWDNFTSSQSVSFILQVFF